MNQKKEIYEKKFNRIIRTFELIPILIFVLGIIISIAFYTLNLKRIHKDNQEAAYETFSTNLEENAIIYNKNIELKLKINQFNENLIYKVVIKVGENTVIEKSQISEEENFEVTMNEEGKKDIRIILYNGEELLADKTVRIYIIEPYSKNFLDELSNKGVQVHYRDGSMEAFEKSLKLIKESGIKNVRADILPVKIANNSVYDYGYYDKWIKAVTENNINIIAIISSWTNFGGKDEKLNDDKEIKLLAEFVEKFHTDYPQIKEYEIFNEPNINSKYNTEEGKYWYSEAIREIYNVMKKQSSITIISGATATYDINLSENFLSDIINLGTYKYTNAFSIHPYDWRNEKEQNKMFYYRLNSHSKLYNINGGFIQKYITEYGLSSYKSNGMNESLQAEKNIQQTVVLDKYNVDKAILYNFWNTGNDETNMEHNFGLITNDYVPKLSYYAMKNYYQNTNGAEYIGSLNITNGLEAHTYDKDGHPLIIAWSNNTDNTYNFTLNQMTAKDIYGKEITPDSNGQIQITTSPVYLYNVPTNYFYQAISNTATTKYNEFTENYAEQISKVQGLQQTINTLNQRMKDLSSTSNLDETTSINLMKQHFNLGNTLIQAYKSGTLQIEYVKLSSMLDALNDIGNSFEDLVTVSAKTRNANISETLDTINKADNLINDNDIEMIYPSKILQFSQDFYDKASYINGLEEENDIKTGLIVSKNLHSKLLADWATQFANLYIDTYIKNNPVTIDYSETNPTNQNVTATLRTNVQITINNNSNSKAYTFTQNGTFTFDYTIKGQTFQQTATVNNIDKTAPTIEGAENDRLYLSEVTPKASDTNLKEVLLYKDNNQVQNYQQNTKITEDGHYKLVAEDSAGNQTSVEFDISRNPAIIDYSEVNLTNQDVVATVNSNFDVNVKNNSNQKSYTFKENGEFTFELNIKGAELQLTAKVDNIDKTPPTITDVEDKKQYIDKVTPKISDDNLNEVKLYFDSEEVQGYTPNSEITGEGFYKLVAKDLAGNETSVEFTIIENPDEKYQIKDGNILNIKNNTNQDAFRKKLKMSGEYSIYRNDTLISDNDKIATGDKLRKSTGEEYTLIVSGDINNDGDVNIKDIVMLRKYLLERNNLDENSLLAADCNLDGKDISIKDLIRMRLIALERDVN